jgi:hypothetical protein
MLQYVCLHKSSVEGGNFTFRAVIFVLGGTMAFEGREEGRGSSIYSVAKLLILAHRKIQGLL